MDEKTVIDTGEFLDTNKSVYISVDPNGEDGYFYLNNSSGNGGFHIILDIEETTNLKNYLNKFVK